MTATRRSWAPGLGGYAALVALSYATREDNGFVVEGLRVREGHVQQKESFVFESLFRVAQLEHPALDFAQFSHREPADPGAPQQSALQFEFVVLAQQNALQVHEVGCGEDGDTAPSPAARLVSACALNADVRVTHLATRGEQLLVGTAEHSVIVVALEAFVTRLSRQVQMVRLTVVRQEYDLKSVSAQAIVNSQNYAGVDKRGHFFATCLSDKMYFDKLNNTLNLAQLELFDSARSALALRDARGRGDALLVSTLAGGVYLFRYFNPNNEFDSLQMRDAVLRLADEIARQAQSQQDPALRPRRLSKGCARLEHLARFLEEDPKYISILLQQALPTKQEGFERLTPELVLECVTRMVTEFRP